MIEAAFHIAELESVIVILRQQKEALTLRFERAESQLLECTSSHQKQNAYVAELESHLAALLLAGEPFERWWHRGAPVVTTAEWTALAAALEKAREAKR